MVTLSELESEAGRFGIGVVTGTYDEGQNMNLAAPASSVTGLYGAAAEETK